MRRFDRRQKLTMAFSLLAMLTEVGGILFVSYSLMAMSLSLTLLATSFFFRWKLWRSSDLE